ncbi:hypothetical protein DSO57_1038298 [Entomophthora muscae]|uniref:Uncharacterized protein n=1 Tax=Entomophthora muscae TaxID=34485 RepID=A0ACC2T9R2_9FUNG|nr:hypothetical protein DSO57_1038298 [Entomophthora muscae]
MCHKTTPPHCIVASEPFELLPNQGWAGNGTQFIKFHTSIPSPNNLKSPCMRDLKNIQAVEGSYHKSLNEQNLTILLCPSEHFCVFESYLHSNQTWAFNKTNFKHPSSLTQHLKNLVQSSIYHLVVHGPASGTIGFRAIQYRASYTLKQKYHLYQRFKQVSVFENCQVYLPTGAHDGVLTFNPD